VPWAFDHFHQERTAERACGGYLLQGRLEMRNMAFFTHAGAAIHPQMKNAELRDSSALFCV
jgi:hypothetical protein